jgi:hypothetical protein
MWSSQLKSGRRKEKEKKEKEKEKEQVTLINLETLTWQVGKNISHHRFQRHRVSPRWSQRGWEKAGHPGAQWPESNPLHRPSTPQQTTREPGESCVVAAAAVTG